MNLLDTVKNRKSVRAYSAKEVEAEKLEYILECVRLAPSAVNFQPWHFYVIKNSERKALLHQCYAREWFVSAPLYIVACGNTSQSWKRKSDGKDHLDIDVAIAVEHICLAAAEQGLGTCWVCNFDVEMCCRLLDLPPDLCPIAIIPVGYPLEEQNKPSSRKLISEIVTVWE